MGIWQIIYLAITMLGLGIHLAEHGKPKDGKYNFGAALLGAGIEIGILYLGGFFS